jgi:hypothetical protein
MKGNRKENKPRQKVRIYADGQYEDCCNAIPVLERASRRPWNYPKDPEKIRDQNMNKRRSFKEALKAR